MYILIVLKKNILKGLGNKIALITIDENWSENEITYRDLDNYVQKFAFIINKKSKNSNQIMMVQRLLRPQSQCFLVQNLELHIL